jgi:hypothetical protein
MLKLLLAPSAIALAAALSSAGSEGSIDQQNAQCVVAHPRPPSATMVSSVERRFDTSPLTPSRAPILAKASMVESNPDQESSAALLENLCIIIRWR